MEQDSTLSIVGSEESDEDVVAWDPFRVQDLGVAGEGVVVRLSFGWLGGEAFREGVG